MYKIRELERKDLAEINKWRNDNDLISSLTANFRYINQEIDYKWYDSYIHNRNNTVRCAIVNSNDEILGTAGLKNVDYLNQKADFFIMIGLKANRGKGIGYFATREILKHAFYNLNLNRIELIVLESNKNAINLYKKVGFIEEGKKRKCIFKNGKFVNVIIMSILNEEFIY